MNTFQLMNKLKGMKNGQVIVGINKGKEYRFLGIEEYYSRGKSPDYDGKLVVVLESEQRKRRKIKLFIEIIEYFVKHDGEYISHGKLPPEYCSKYRIGVSYGVPNLIEYESHYKSLAMYLCK